MNGQQYLRQSALYIQTRDPSTSPDQMPRIPPHGTKFAAIQSFRTLSCQLHISASGLTFGLTAGFLRGRLYLISIIAPIYSAQTKSLTWITLGIPPANQALQGVSASTLTFLTEKDKIYPIYVSCQVKQVNGLSVGFHPPNPRRHNVQRWIPMDQT